MARPDSVDEGGSSALPFDALLYGALLVLLTIAIFSDGAGPLPALGTEVGVLPAWQIWAVLGVLAVLGLRDKVIFLAARGEVYRSRLRSCSPATVWI